MDQPLIEPTINTVLTSCYVIGTPVPKGSMSGFPGKGSRRVILVDQQSARLKKWKKDIQSQIVPHASSEHCLLSSGAYHVTLMFLLPRPKYHFATGTKQVKQRLISLQHRVKPDVDKLVRAVLDSLTGYIWTDDAHVASVLAQKGYSPNEEGGMFIEIKHMPDDYEATLIANP